MFEKQVFFGMYCLMSPFTFSIALLLHPYKEICSEIE